MSLRTGAAVALAYALGFAAGSWATEAHLRRHENETREEARAAVDRVFDEQARELDRMIGRAE